MRAWISSWVKRIFSISGCDGMLERSQTELEQQVLDIFLVEHADVDLRIELAQQTQFAVLVAHQGLLHHGEFHIEIELGQKEIRSEGFPHVARAVPFHGERARLVLPGQTM